ncbi:MAG: hypothetical protein ACPGVT_06610 [Maricaulaceae bacterium]
MEKKSELMTTAYWVGHGVVIVATIIGVYLAASVGFKKAVDLEILRADRGTYYVATSLLMETENNMEQFQGYIDEAAKHRLVYNEHIEGVKLNDFIFQAAKYSDSTFEMDPEVLNTISQYYVNTGSVIEAYNNKVIGPAKVVATLKAENKKMEDGGLEAFKTHVEDMKKALKKKGLKL